MSNDDISMYVQLLSNQRVVTCDKLRGTNPMVISDPWDDSLDIIALHPVRAPHKHCE